MLKYTYAHTHSHVYIFVFATMLCISYELWYCLIKTSSIRLYNLFIYLFIFLLYLFGLLLAVLGTESRTFNMLGNCSTSELLLQNQHITLAYFIYFTLFVLCSTDQIMQCTYLNIPQWSTHTQNTHIYTHKAPIIKKL